MKAEDINYEVLKNYVNTKTQKSKSPLIIKKSVIEYLKENHMITIIKNKNGEYVSNNENKLISETFIILCDLYRGNW